LLGRILNVVNSRIDCKEINIEISILTFASGLVLNRSCV